MKKLFILMALIGGQGIAYAKAWSNSGDKQYCQERYQSCVQDKSFCNRPYASCEDFCRGWACAEQDNVSPNTRCSSGHAPRCMKKPVHRSGQIKYENYCECR